MNTAINLQVKSIKNPLNKSYTFKLFSKGKIVIAGLSDAYEQSEVNVVVHSFLSALASFS